MAADPFQKKALDLGYGLDSHAGILHLLRNGVDAGHGTRCIGHGLRGFVYLRMDEIDMTVEDGWFAKGDELLVLVQFFRNPFQAAEKHEVYAARRVLHGGHQPSLAPDGPGA